MLGFSKEGVDFHSLDQSISQAVFLILIPENDPQSQLEIIAQVATLFSKPEVIQEFIECQSADEIVAFLKSISH